MPAGTVAIAMEDVVLARDSGSYAASIPIQEGVAVARLLQGVGPLIFLTESTDEKPAIHWLKVNGLKFSRVVTPEPADADLSPPRVQCRQIARLRALGGLWLVLTGEPEVGLWCFEIGQPAAVFLQPTYRSSAPETQIKPWGDLAAATARARLLTAQDEATEGIEFE